MGIGFHVFRLPDCHQVVVPGSDDNLFVRTCQSWNCRGVSGGLEALKMSSFVPVANVQVELISAPLATRLISSLVQSTYVTSSA